MKERPIIYNAEMVRAISDGRKTQTRRLIRPQPFIDPVAPDRLLLWKDASWIKDRIMCRHCHLGYIGDRLWVRETFLKYQELYFYRADNDGRLPDSLKQIDVKWKPSIHMPREASRITLEITEVRVERLMDISERDAIAEGIDSQIGFAQMTWWKDYAFAGKGWLGFDSPIKSFKTLWDSIYVEKYPWVSNPWVWVINFKIV